MQIRKHTGSWGVLPHTSKPSLEQVVRQEPLGRSRAEKGMGVPVQPGATVFSNSLSWARCQQHRIPLANTLGRAPSSCVSSFAAPCLHPGGMAHTGHGHLLHNPPFTQTQSRLKSLWLKVVQHCDALPPDNEVEQRIWAK